MAYPLQKPPAGRAKAVKGDIYIDQISVRFGNIMDFLNGFKKALLGVY